MEQQDIYERYFAAIGVFYHFILVAGDDVGAKHDYGTGKELNTVEMHTLAMIADDPGLCITDVAKQWNRTLGAASKNVNKLAAKGYVEKRKLPGNDKTIHLYPTDKGKHLAELHRQYDREHQTKALEYLLKHHTPEELETFYSVLKTMLDVYVRNSASE